MRLGVRGRKITMLYFREKSMCIVTNWWSFEFPGVSWERMKCSDEFNVRKIVENVPLSFLRVTSDYPCNGNYSKGAK